MSQHAEDVGRPVTRITIDLPVPDHTVSDRGFTYLAHGMGQERSHADRPMVNIYDQDMTVAEAEEWALAVLWLVRNHYQGNGLRCEVPTPTGRKEET